MSDEVDRGKVGCVGGLIKKQGLDSVFVDYLDAVAGEDFASPRELKGFGGSWRTFDVNLHKGHRPGRHRWKGAYRYGEHMVVRGDWRQDLELGEELVAGFDGFSRLLHTVTPLFFTSALRDRDDRKVEGSFSSWFVDTCNQD